MSLINYIPKFLTEAETAELFAACSGLKFTRAKTRYGKDERHATLSFSKEYSPHAGKKGTLRPLSDAPTAIQSLAEKLSKYAVRMSTIWQSSSTRLTISSRSISTRTTRRKDTMRRCTSYQ